MGTPMPREEPEEELKEIMAGLTWEVCDERHEEQNWQRQGSGLGSLGVHAHGSVC